jgi:hypothetical protein
MQTHKGVPIARAPLAFDRQNTLRLISFMPLSTTSTDLLDSVSNPEAGPSPIDLFNHPCPLRLGSIELPLHQLDFERFRMTGMACEATSVGASSQPPRGETNLLSRPIPFGTHHRLTVALRLGGRRPFRETTARIDRPNHKGSAGLCGHTPFGYGCPQLSF